MDCRRSIQCSTHPRWQMQSNTQLSHGGGYANIKQWLSHQICPSSYTHHIQRAPERSYYALSTVLQNRGKIPHFKLHHERDGVETRSASYFGQFSFLDTTLIRVDIRYLWIQTPIAIDRILCIVVSHVLYSQNQ